MNLGVNNNNNNSKQNRKTQADTSAKKQNMKSNSDLFQTSPEEDEDEEVVQDEPKKAKKSKVPIFIVIGAVVSILALFIVAKAIFSSGNEEQQPTQDQTQQQTTQTSSNQQVQPNQQGQAETGTEQQTQQHTPPNGEKDIGFQDFTGNTNMKTSNELVSPDEALKDVYNLSVRVDYEVDDIDSVTDFVNYTKCRGTWGGGLELYWLDATYKNTHYIVQIPFKYYKELDDTGIVPVKMEVLRINTIGSATDGERTIVSYMTLDEATLKTLLKNRK